MGSYIEKILHKINKITKKCEKRECKIKALKKEQLENSGKTKVAQESDSPYIKKLE